MNTKILLTIVSLIGAATAATGPHGAPMCKGCTVTGTGGDRSLWGWENNVACEINTSKCKVSTTTKKTTSKTTKKGPHGSPICTGCTVTGTGGDKSLWGWENNKACEIDTAKCGKKKTTVKKSSKKATTKKATKKTTKKTTKKAATANKKVTTNKKSTRKTTTKKSTVTTKKTNNSSSGNIKVIGSRRNGKTTRYWDCCKPSCSWSGKANVSHPVNTCKRNGSLISDFNARSGCDGGEAYTCTDQTPWAINDNLSYGFAAAHISGGSEATWCCACYRLTFTDTAVKGKQLVVQVTNTGGDLGENHFDLQIPGGGLGIFDGCSSQFNTNAASWGERYGGVRDVSGCNNLPKALQAGCKWRFNWFKNADNPNMVFEEVQCPTELTKKTGCVRR